jgi:hypothetical protein
MRWQHVIAWSYAVIFGGVLPFICWGAWAQPGHPHSRPHFVFAMPEMAAPAEDAAIGHAHADALERHGMAHADAHAHHDSRSGAAQSQSLPDLLLLLLILGVFPDRTGYRYRNRHEARSLSGFLTIAQRAPQVPTPPPRPA